MRLSVILHLHIASLCSYCLCRIRKCHSMHEQLIGCWGHFEHQLIALLLNLKRENRFGHSLKLNSHHSNLDTILSLDYSEKVRLLLGFYENIRLMQLAMQEYKLQLLFFFIAFSLLLSEHSAPAEYKVQLEV